MREGSLNDADGAGRARRAHHGVPLGPDEFGLVHVVPVESDRIPTTTWRRVYVVFGLLRVIVRRQLGVELSQLYLDLFGVHGPLLLFIGILAARRQDLEVGLILFDAWGALCSRLGVLLPTAPTCIVRTHSCNNSWVKIYLYVIHRVNVKT